MRKGQPSSSRACRHDRGVRGRFEEGIRASKVARTFARVGRTTRAIHFRVSAVRVARCSRFPARGGNSKRRHEARRLMLAVGDATLRSNGPCIVVLQKSSGRSQALRSAPFAASGSKARTRQGAGGRCLAKGGTPRARKRTGRKGRKGNGESELGDPHHVNAHAIDERVVVRSCFGTGGSCGATGDGRYLGPQKRASFTGPPRSRSWRPSSSRIELAIAIRKARERRRRQGYQRLSRTSGPPEENAGGI